MTDQRYPPLRPQPPVHPPRRSATPWPMIIGVAVLVLLALAILFVLLNGGADDAPTGSASPGSGSPSTSAQASASTAPSGSVAASASASASVSPAGGLAPDAVVATAVEALTLRSAPGVSSEARWRLPEGALAFVIGGPVQADGLPWYQLSGMGLPYASGCVTPEPGQVLECPAFLGWVAATGEDGEPYLVPTTPPTCPDAPHTVVSLSEVGFTLRLICFDTEPITFTAFLAEPPADAPSDCPAADTETGWIACGNIGNEWLSADAAEGAGRFTAFIDPATGLAIPERGQWVEVSGHFDDPAARRCGEVADAMSADPGELVFTCRLAFVLSAIAPTTAP